MGPCMSMRKILRVEVMKSMIPLDFHPLGVSFCVYAIYSGTILFYPIPFHDLDLLPEGEKKSFKLISIGE